MKRNGYCKHPVTRFHSVQRLGNQPPIELRQCVLCHSTVSGVLAEPIPATGAAASH